MAETSYITNAKKEKVLSNKWEDQLVKMNNLHILPEKTVLTADPSHQHKKYRTQMATNCVTRSGNLNKSVIFLCVETILVMQNDN